MIIDIETEIKVTISLSKAEARWMKRLCSNPVPSFQEETDMDRDRREQLYNVLNRQDL